jgi:ribosome-interacting GTPase 1
VEIAIAVLFISSIVLIALSYFQRDSIKDVEQELESLQLSAMQEIYKLKKKMTVLEEELLDTSTVSSNAKLEHIDQHTIKQILSKYSNGMSAEAISKAEHVSVEDVRAIIKDNERVLV